jgi:hypothetical protein
MAGLAGGAVGGLGSAYDLAYHARNRVYMPGMGRFTGADPNESGVPTLHSVVWGGMPLQTVADGYDLAGRALDGLNFHAAYGGNPLGAQDPTGLTWGEWWRDTKDGAGLLWNGFQTFMAMSDVHGLVQNMAESLLDNYSMNLEADADWAGDWSMPDDAHTRTSSKWVNEAMILGAHRHFNLEYWEETFALRQGGYGPAMAGMTSTGVEIVERGAMGLRELAKFLGKLRPGMIFESYTLAKTVKYMKGVGSLFEAHHLLPKSWANLLQLNANGPAVLLTKAMHQPITAELNRILKTLKGMPRALRKAEAWKELSRVYASKPEWLEAIAPMFVGNGR